jgi:hypothetical protein
VGLWNQVGFHLEGGTHCVDKFIRPFLLDIESHLWVIKLIQILIEGKTFTCFLIEAWEGSVRYNTQLIGIFGPPLTRFTLSGAELTEVEFFFAVRLKSLFECLES